MFSLTSESYDKDDIVKTEEHSADSIVIVWEGGKVVVEGEFEFELDILQRGDRLGRAAESAVATLLYKFV